MAETVYILCALMCAVCAILLFRGWRRSRARLLFWSGLCFAGLTANNILLFLDKITFPNIDLLTLRVSVGLASLMILLYGLIVDAE
ncbi:MAG TPA: DUF5985 family protein [Tepidisphaeraceae bacterium]|nr:DUF5985 family protein [Tepidisphaeraceae bacterium]